MAEIACICLLYIFNHRCFDVSKNNHPKNTSAGFWKNPTLLHSCWPKRPLITPYCIENINTYTGDEISEKVLSIRRHFRSFSKLRVSVSIQHFIFPQTTPHQKNYHMDFWDKNWKVFTLDSKYDSFKLKVIVSIISQNWYNFLLILDYISVFLKVGVVLIAGHYQGNLWNKWFQVQYLWKNAISAVGFIFVLLKCRIKYVKKFHVT